jgi:polyisoprenoid-binding protein YceI
MSLSRFTLAVLPVALLLAQTGCEDPAKDKPKASVSSAAPGTTTAAAAPLPTGAETLAVDPASSSVGFVGAKVTGNHPGTFQKFTGSISLVGGKAEGGAVKLEAETASLKTDDPKLDGHLSSPDFFDTARFPKATFTSTAIKAGGDKGATHTITGELELHGVKKTISFPATIAVTADGATGTSEFSINRKDFGINYPGKADDLIRDDVLLKLSLKAPRKKG